MQRVHAALAVVVFPEDPTKWTAQSRHLATVRPDQNGQFRLETLPPADYLAIAVEYLEDGDSGGPEFLNRVRDMATRFTLGEAESKSLSLKLAKIE